MTSSAARQAPLRSSRRRRRARRPRRSCAGGAARWRSIRHPQGNSAAGRELEGLGLGQGVDGVAVPAAHQPPAELGGETGRPVQSVQHRPIGGGAASTTRSSGCVVGIGTNEPSSPGRYERSAVACHSMRAAIGLPASSPRNSPTCHWRASIHSGSATRASTPASSSSSRRRALDAIPRADHDATSTTSALSNRPGAKHVGRPCP